jgi:DNA-binding CsgD family transcriptional regulator
MARTLAEIFESTYREAQVSVKEKKDPFTSLSPRQEELLELVVAGASNKSIAEKLSIAENTVRNHVAAIFAKLKVNNRTEASYLYHKRAMGAMNAASPTNSVMEEKKALDRDHGHVPYSHVSGIHDFLNKKYGK